MVKFIEYFSELICSYQSVMTQLWVGNTEIWQSEEQLIAYVREKCGITVRSVWFVRNKTSGQLEGFGFMDFDKVSEAAHVMKLLKDTAIPHAQGARFRLNWGSAGSEADMETIQQESGYQVYVGNLPSTVTDERLLQFFRKYFPSAISAKLIRSPDGFSQGYGFVKFNTLREVKEAITQLNGSREFGKAIKVSEGRANRIHRQSDADATSTTLFLRDIDPEIVKEDTLRHHFAPYGNVLRVRIISEHPDWAYVTMETKAEAESAKNALQGSRFGGTTKCDIQFGRPVDDTSSAREHQVSIPIVKPKSMSRRQQSQYFDDAGVDRVMAIITRVAEINRLSPIVHCDTKISNRLFAHETLETQTRLFDWNCSTPPTTSYFWCL